MCQDYIWLLHADTHAITYREWTPHQDPLRTLRVVRQSEVADGIHG